MKSTRKNGTKFQKNTRKNPYVNLIPGGEERRTGIDINNINDRTCKSCYFVGKNYASTKNGKQDSKTRTHKLQEFLLDSGATTHVMTSDENALYVKKATGYVLVGNGEKCESTRLARYTLEEEDTKSRIDLKNAVVIEGFEKNIISMLRLHDDGYEFDINKERCVITKKNDRNFKINLKPGEKGAYYLRCRAITQQGGRSTDQSAYPLEDEMWREVSQPINLLGNNIVHRKHSRPKSMDINKLHDTLGHKGEGLLRKTCKHLGIKVTGEMKACEACGIAKAKQKALSKTTSNRATKPGQRLFFDTAGPY